MTNIQAITTNWRDIGDTTLAVYRSEFARVKSPMLAGVEAIYEAAKPHSALILAHSWMENQHNTTNIEIPKDAHNFLAMRPEYPGEKGPHGSGVVYTAHTGQFLRFASFADCIKEWHRRTWKDAGTYKGYGPYKNTTTLKSYIAVYAPAGDVHGVTGKDNADINYLGTVTTMLERFAAAEKKNPAPSQPSTQPTEEPTMATHRFILSPGHRNTDAGGAWKGPESAWTYPICKKLKAAIERRGGKAWIISEHDNDNDPSTSKGRGLQNVAYLAAALAKQLGGVDAYLSMHYGAEPVDGFFAIFPDATGLSPSSETDVRGNNTLDIRLARTLANHVKKTGMPIRGDGTMSETRSGVGLGGYRLGELYGTRELQPTTPRLIVEGGNSLDPDEYNLLWSSAWQDRYVNALVDGLEEVFGKFKATPAPQPPQKPDIDPNEGLPRLFTIRFEVPVREAPGFVGKIVTNLPAGTTGTIIEGPKVVDGIDWYNLRIEGFGTGWVQDRILHTLEITSVVDTLTDTLTTALS